MTGRSRRVFGDIRFMVTPGARPRNIRVAGDGTLWGEVPLVLYREVAFEPTKGGPYGLHTGQESSRSGHRDSRGCTG